MIVNAENPPPKTGDGADLLLWFSLILLGLLGIGGITVIKIRK